MDFGETFNQRLHSKSDLIFVLFLMQFSGRGGIEARVAATKRKEI